MFADPKARSRSYISSQASIVILSVAASCGVLICSLLIQWLVYDDWLHHTGPLHLVGTSLAALLTFIFVFRWQQLAREREREMMRRLQMIAEMNDRIRNALQAIELVTYSSQPQATGPVRHAVDVIDRVLRDVLDEASQFRNEPAKKGSRAAAAGDERKSA